MLKKLFSNERLSRLMVSLLLCFGVLWPLMWALEIQSMFLPATLVAAAVILLLTISGVSKKLRVLMGIAVAALFIVQLFLKNAGLFGDAIEAIKAFALYLNGLSSAAPLFRVQLAMTLAVAAALVSYLFSHKGAGFIPATVLLVLVLFGLWSLGKHSFFWFAAPGLAALLMIIAQTSHEKVNLFEVLPMAAIVVVLAMLLTPAGRTVIEPLHKAAMDLKETISDYLFFTEPRNVFTLGSYGYYPMGQGKLGGAAEPSEYPVMMVQTEQKTLMRGVIKDFYTGRSWQDTSSGRRLLYVHPGWRGQRNAVFLENMPDQSVQRASTLLDTKAINVQVQNKAASTLFTPVFLRDVSPQGSLIPYFNDASELFVTRDLELNDRYTVFAPVFEGGSAAVGALVDAAYDHDPNYQKAREMYLQLPAHLEPTLYEDLQNIVAGSATPYDQACAILRHLQRYYRYTLTPEEPPENLDFVTYFLYVGKEGYCTYYASAMTVLCRMAGIPARYVEGFIAQPSADGIAYVTGLDAHAWTEVYFEGFGWVPFDPTPSQQNLDSQDLPPEEPEPTPTPTPTPEPEDEQPTPTPDPQNPDPTPSPEQPEESNEPDMEEPEDDPQNDPPKFDWWWLLLVLAVIAALVARIVLRTPDRMAAKQPDTQSKIFIYGNATAQVLRMRGRKVQPGETPMLFARRMDKQKATPTPLVPLWRAMVLSNYSRKTPAPQLADSARATFRAVYKPQSAWTKLRFLLTAAFSDGFYRMLDTPVEHVEPKRLYELPGKDTGRKKEHAAGKRKASCGRRPVPVNVREEKPVEAMQVTEHIDQTAPVRREAENETPAELPRRRRRKE